jgi:23S rRNA pseudouridine1911/1915/1917 synthase
VDGRRAAKAGHKLRGGEEICLELPPPEPTGLVAEDIPVPIVYQDEHLLVVDKPAGLVVHPARGHASGTLVNALLHLLDEGDEEAPLRPGVVHRIDRGTSGLLVVCRSEAARAGLSPQFADHSIERRYLALVLGLPAASGTVDQPLGRHPRDRLRFAVVPGGRRAVTHWRRLGEATAGTRDRPQRLSLLECRLETGRTHQIRVHLSHIGHPLVGDPLYTPERQRLPAPLDLALPDLDHQLLHAAALGFIHPVSGQRLRFEAPLPADYASALTCLGLAPPGQVL